MSEDLRHECGVAALYWLAEAPTGRNGRVGRNGTPANVAALLPGMLLDLQNRGQLAAGFSTFNPDRA
jgi:amidophosphoribosyltransferase